MSKLKKANKKIFISHSNEDEDIVNKIHNFLIKHGLDCWIAKKNIIGGEDYAQAIVTAIKNSQIFLLVYSKESNDSDFVRMEVERAASNKIKIIVFRLDNIYPSGTLEFFLSSVHWIDAFENSLESSIEKLYYDCNSILEIPPRPIIKDKKMMFFNPFFLTGRISRLEYFLSWSLFWTFWIGLGFIAKYRLHEDIELLSPNGILTSLILLLLFWFMTAQSIKRCHDISKTGWYILNPLSFFLLPFIKSFSKRNKYGSNPKKQIHLESKRSISNILITSLFSLFVILFSSGIFSNESIAKQKIKNNHRVFETKDFFMQYPSSWGIDSTNAKKGELRIYSPYNTDDIFQDNVSLSITNLNGRNINLSQYVHLSEKQISNGVILKGAVLVSSERMKKNQEEYQKIVFKINYEKLKIKAISYSFIKNSRAYDILFIFEENKDAAFITQGENILNSFTFK